MVRLKWMLLILMGSVLLVRSVGAQGSFSRWEGGFRGGALFAGTELADGIGVQGAGFVRVRLSRRWLSAWTAGYGQMKGTGFDSDIWSTDTRMVLHRTDVSKRWSTYLYGGLGLMRHRIIQFPANQTPGADPQGWSMIFPGGVGLGKTLGQTTKLDLQLGYTYTFRDDLNGAATEKGNDVFWSWTMGISFGRFPKPVRKEKESAMGNALIPVMDTSDDDGDGLRDVDEIIIYGTHPDQADSDGDGLSDFEEVRTHYTNPNAVDSDSDGLGDREEILEYKTNPHRADSDGDGLSDGDEVGLHRTDPGVADTDAGGMSDGNEIVANKNPLDAVDDAVKPPPPVVHFEPVYFTTGSADLTLEARQILDRAVGTLQAIEGLRLEVRGYTDSQDRSRLNQLLSELRAKQVRDYLIQAGIEPERLTVKALGEEAPVSSNETEAGRRENRRVELIPLP